MKGIKAAVHFDIFKQSESHGSNFFEDLSGLIDLKRVIGSRFKGHGSCSNSVIGSHLFRHDHT